VIRIDGVLARAAAPALFLAATSVGPASAQAPRGSSVAFEADALAYAVSGNSGILRVSLANCLNIALGAGRYEVAGFIVEGQDDYEEAG
jgi:hypothetical protein